jgi:hypothetical protein
MLPMIVVRMVPSERTTRILVSDASGDEILKARLPPSGQAHRLATRTLLEAIALFCNARLRVVLSADSEAISFAQGLCDGLGLGIDTVYYEVEILAPRPQRQRGLSGRSDLRDVRRLRLIKGRET